MASVVVPLAITAAVGSSQWWTLSAFASAAWWFGSPRWSWLVSVEAGLFGAEWAVAGGVALRDLPHLRVPVELTWLALPVGLACVSAWPHLRRTQLAGISYRALQGQAALRLGEHRHT